MEYMLFFFFFLHFVKGRGYFYAVTVSPVSNDSNYNTMEDPIVVIENRFKFRSRGNYTIRQLSNMVKKFKLSD